MIKEKTDITLQWKIKDFSQRERARQPIVLPIIPQNSRTTKTTTTKIC